MCDIFVDVKGQDDNLGDSVLRRGLVDALRAPGCRLHLHTGEASQSYLSGLGVTEGDALYSSFYRWVQAIRASSSPSLSMQAGEVVLRHRPTRDHGWYMVATACVKARHGAVSMTGAGIRKPIRWPRFSGSLVGNRLGDLVAWRDDLSRITMGRGRVCPDWAFALGTPTSEWVAPESRRILAVSMRFDRPAPSDDWIDRVREYVSGQELDIVTFAQVVRDGPRAQSLARQLGGTYVEWGVSHAEMEMGARKLFGSARYVLSDRAHALIIGATEGAAPIGSAPLSIEKLARTLGAAGLVSSVGLQSDVERQLASARDIDLKGAIERARQQLAELGAELRRLHSCQ